MVIAHPSHELRLHGWVQIARPHLFVLTDGSGRAGESQLDSTTKVLEDAGATRGTIYGRFTDLDVYTAFLNHDYDLFISLVEELAEQFDHHQIEYVVGDSAEGYNSTHDACRLVINAAIEIVTRKFKREIANFDFAVVGQPEECPDAIRNDAIWLSLDDETFRRKIAAVKAYNSKLAADVEAALNGQAFQGLRRFSAPQVAGNVDEGLVTEIRKDLPSYPNMDAIAKGAFEGIELDRFRIECLRPVRADINSDSEEIRYYEMYGEKMVAAGHYETAIRYKEHFLPLAQAVRRYVETIR